MALGFILQPTYRIENDRPVVHLFGRLEGGRSFLVRDDRQSPHFWIRAADADRAREFGAEPRDEQPAYHARCRRIHGTRSFDRTRR